jgi:hypothetical protein
MWQKISEVHLSHFNLNIHPAAFPNVHFVDTGLFGYLGSQLQVAFLPDSCEKELVI